MIAKLIFLTAGNEHYGIEESGTSDTSEIMTSELDSEALQLMRPKEVRKKLSHLVQSKIPNAKGFKVRQN